MVTNGTYVLSSEIISTNSISIRSVNGPLLTVVDGNDSTRCFNISFGLLSGFTITRGHADAGGGLWSVSNRLENCIIEGNTAQNAGGGIWDVVSTIQNCLIYDNAVTNGAGYCQGGGAALRGSVLRNCTVTRNSACGSGGGVVCMGETVENCVIYGNEADTDANYANLIGLDCNFSYCCTTPTNGLLGSGNITNDPKFVDRAMGNLRLLSDSPCIDRGTNQDWMIGATDLDGNPRITNGRVDMGAYEFNGQIGPIIDSISPTNGFVTTNATVGMQIVAHSPAGVAQVTVNGNAAQDSGNNTWSYVAPLSVGLNVFTVIVTDNADLTVTGRVQYVRSTASAGLLGHWTFDGGNASDVSGNGNNGVIIGATVASGVSGEAYHFDGNSRIEVGNLSFDTQEYTVNGWIRTTEPAVTGCWRMWIAKMNPPSGDATFELFIGDGRRVGGGPNGPCYLVGGRRVSA